MVNRPLIYAIVYTVLTFTFVDAAEHEIFQFGKICSLRPQQITEDLPFYVYYDSMFETGPIWCSYIGFSARGANSRDKYQICTTLHTFRDPMCSVKVSLRNSLNGTALRTFSCTETSKSKFCVTQGEDLYIVLDFMSSVEEKPAEFIFYVDATKTYNHIATVAGVSVGVAAICIVIFVLIVVKCRNRKSHSPLLRNRFRNTSVSFFCRNTPCNQESSQSSTASSLVGTEDIESRQPIGYRHFPPVETLTRTTINNVSSINPCITRGNSVSHILDPPPPYQERGEDSLSPPAYSSLYM